MLRINRLRQEKEQIIALLARRENYSDLAGIIEQIIDTDDQRKAIQTDRDNHQAQQNKLSKEIGQLYAQKKIEEAEQLKQQVQANKEATKELENRYKEIESKLEQLLLQVPNVPNELVPPGKGEDDNEVYQDWSGPLEHKDYMKPHWDLIEKFDLIDFGLGAKITGSGFPLYKGLGARLQRALISYFLDQATEAGFVEIIPPHLVNATSAKATGQLPDKEGQMYHATADDLYLIPTSEVPVTNIYRDAILEESDFPIKMTAYTPCFRREAGSYGSDVKGLNRVHQFDKVEIVVLSHPEKSYDMLKYMTEHVEYLLKALELPYRILTLCGGDLGFTSALTYDFEVYCLGQEKWLEVSSVSNFETYQSNRLNLRYKDQSGKKHLAHTLNGSALALARIVAAIIENNQSEDGTYIEVPAVLVPYLGTDKIK